MSTGVQTQNTSKHCFPAQTQSSEAAGLIQELQEQFGGGFNEVVMPKTLAEAKARLVAARKLYITPDENGFLRSLPQVAREVGLTTLQLIPTLQAEGWERIRTGNVASTNHQPKSDRANRVDNFVSDRLEEIIANSFAVYGEVIEEIRAMPSDDVLNKLEANKAADAQAKAQNLVKTTENQSETSQKQASDNKTTTGTQQQPQTPPVPPTKSMEKALKSVGIKLKRPQVDIKIDRMNAVVEGLSRLVDTAKNAGLMLQPSSDGLDFGDGQGFSGLDSKTLTSITLALSKVTTTKPQPINVTPKFKKKK